MGRLWLCARTPLPAVLSLPLQFRISDFSVAVPVSHRHFYRSNIRGVLRHVANFVFSPQTIRWAPEMTSLTIKTRVVVSALLVAFVAGCGGSGVKPIANLVPCRGTVTLDGQPLPHGMVGLEPLEPGAGRSANGAIKDGHFELATSASAAGVVVGKYRVSVQSVSQEKTSSPAEMAKPPKSLIPKKYNDIKTSGLEVEVTKGMQPVELKLVSK